MVISKYMCLSTKNISKKVKSLLSVKALNKIVSLADLLQV